MQPVQTPFAFPRGFIWGAATASHQVEGCLDNDWSLAEKVPGAFRNGDSCQAGVGHLDRFREDFDLAVGMGHNAHRLSLEWSRIEPERGQFDRQALDHYHEVVSQLRARGLTPFVTLHHFTNPRWVGRQGGWCAERTVEDFARYAGAMGREFGHEVRHWITVNEPNIYTLHAYLRGCWPPFHFHPFEALKVLSNYALGHVAAYRALHEAHQAIGAAGPAVGVAHNLAAFDGYGDNRRDAAMARFADRMFNRAFLEAITRGEFDFSIAGLGGLRRHVPKAASSLDFLGVNYYGRGRTRFPFHVLQTPDAPKSDFGWEIYPEGLYRSLRLARSYTHLPDGRTIPILITENGMDDRTGDRRCGFLVSHLQYLARALAEGFDIRGYFHWTLMDNFEWTEGYEPRFGLYRVDRDNGLARVATPTVETFRQLTSANALTADLLERFGCAGPGRPAPGALAT